MLDSQLKEIGNNIAAKRNTESHRLVSEKTGVAVEKLKSIENGTVCPSLGEIRSISCALGTSVSDLLPSGVAEADFD